jgi:HEAT repeat protein
VLPASAELGAALAGALDSADPVVLATALDVLRALKLGSRDLFAGGLRASEPAVRIEAVRALVSLDERDLVASVRTDPSREVRVAVAHGLGSVADPGATPDLTALSDDSDPLVRAAAFEAAAVIKCPPPLDSLAVAALGDPAWQVRKGAAQALGGADPGVAVAPLVAAVHDPDLDVRKSAVRSLARWVDDPVVTSALESARDDSDADVRAYARQALATAPNPAAG